MYQVADLHHLFEDLVLCTSCYRNYTLRNVGTARVQVVPLLARERSTPFYMQISHEIYKRIQKQMEKVKLEEYNSHFGIAISFLCTNTVALLMKLTGKIAAYIDSKHIEEVEKHILEIIKTLEYKKAAINMRHQAAASEVNKELNSSEFNNSMEEEPMLEPVKKIVKSEIGNQMSKILVDLDQ